MSLLSNILHFYGIKCSFPNLSVTSPTSQLILQPFRRFTCVTAHCPILSAHSPTFSSLHLRHSSFSNLSVTSPTSQLILQPFRRFTYVPAQCPTLPLLHLRHSSFSKPSFASHTSQSLHLIHLASLENELQPFHHFTYVTSHSPTLQSLYLRHSPFSNPSVA